MMAMLLMTVVKWCEGHILDGQVRIFVGEHFSFPLILQLGEILISVDDFAILVDGKNHISTVLKNGYPQVIQILIGFSMK